MTNLARSLLVVLPLLSLAATAFAAETAEDKGLAIAVEADRRDAGFGDFSAHQRMTLRNRHGQESTREMNIKVLESPQDGDKSLIVFDRPRDVKGTALLTHSHKVGDDDQWLYLPALKRVKRISSSNKSGSFMGSEFSFEDLTSQEVEKFTYKHLRDEPCGALTCFVLERYPVDPDSGYTRQVAWLDQEAYRLWKVDYYDRKNALLKTFSASNYLQYEDKFWRAGEMSMVNHQTGKSTRLVWTEIKFRNGFSDRDFDRNSLSRAR